MRPRKHQSIAEHDAERADVRVTQHEAVHAAVADLKLAEQSAGPDAELDAGCKERPERSARLLVRAEPLTRDAAGHLRSQHVKATACGCVRRHDRQLQAIAQAES